jgi:hypothetical protein
LSATATFQLTVQIERSLVLLPVAEVRLKPGETKTVPIKVQRTACNGPIHIELQDLPAGTTAEPACRPRWWCCRSSP